MKRVMAFALAGGRTKGLSVLSEPRSVAAVPFAGKFRLIDFTLSNCLNSELYTVAVLAQYAPLSLAAHLGRGEPWDLDRRDGGVTILQPYARQEGARWYEGTADALRQNLDVLENSGAERAFVLSTDLVYKMDFSWVLENHLRSGALATLVVGPTPYGETHRFGMVEVDSEDRVVSFEEKPRESRAPYAFTGIYLFEASFLKRILLETEGSNLILDVLLPMVGKNDRIRAYVFEGYWDDVGGIREYYRAHQRLLEDDPLPDLYDPEWRVYARSEEMLPAVFGEGAEVEASLIANGALVEGRVERSVLSPGVVVGPGATVRDSVLLNGTVIGAGAVVERAVVDKNVRVGDRARVGGASPGGGASSPDGITVVGKWAAIPEEETVPAGTVVAMAPIPPGGEAGMGRTEG
jgi:glucose-1-phosphate adenylyltransferase